MKFRRGIHIYGLDTELLRLLRHAETLANFEFVISSGKRIAHLGAHGKGLAVDIVCSNSRLRLKLLRALLEAGFHRLGVYDRHIHVDIDPSANRDVLWTGVSK